MSTSRAPVIPPRPSSQHVTPTEVIPPRRITQSRTPPPRISVTNAMHSSRRSVQSRTPPPQPSTHNASTSMQSRPTSSITSPPPIPVRWDMCSCHNGQKFTAVCLTCVKFLCNKCLFSEIYFHNQCSVTYLNDNVHEACRGLKQSVCEKIEKLSNNLNKFQTSLCKKRDRMLKKRNETISEIKNYYNSLREAILSKLQSDEEKLLDIMKDQVNEQDAVILDKIQQCCATSGSLQDKIAVIQNFGNSARNGIEYVKELVHAYGYLKRCEQIEKDVSAVRDAFLVIRFFVNSETEQTVLNSNVASVEVLNSQSDPRDRGTLESERIASLQAISNESVSTAHESDVESIQANDGLRVQLPPLNENTDLSRNNQESLRYVEDANVILPQSAESSERDNERESQNTSADLLSEVINEFDTRLEDTSDGSSNELTNEMILSNIQTDVSSANETSDSMVNNRNIEDTSTISDTDAVQSSATEQENESVDSEGAGTPASNDQQPFAAVTVSSESTPQAQQNSVPNDNDPPPPPYPGYTSNPVPPAPDELPPPYPGSGPPPPYSQMPESQQPPGRSRLNGESEGHLSIMQQRLSSDSDLQLRQLEIAAPTQTSSPRMSRPKVSKVFSVNEANDRRVSGIFALMSVRSDAFLIVDRWNKKLKYFSANGESFGGLIFREEPWDITRMSEEIVAVTVPKLNTFYKIKVTNNSVITTSTVSTLRSYACIAFNKVTQLFVCAQVPQFGEPVVDIVGINGGQIIQSFRSGFNNELRFSYPRYIKITEEGTAIVCDWNLKCLTVFKLDGTVIGTYRGTVEFPLNEPTGIAYNTSTKEIYVIDAKHSSTHGAIHIVNLNCRCREIVRWDNEFRVARAITPHSNGYALGNKSGVLSIFASRQRR